jgi:iron complex outermembrane receptor protein
MQNTTPKTCAWIRALCCGTAVAAITTAPAHAQTGPAKSPKIIDDTTISEVVVTGTLVRGVAPAGTNVIALSDGAIQETGATTTAQLLQTIPQFGAFNTLSAPVAAGNTVTSNRPNLRSLPGFNNSGGSTTLVLMDGRRIVGSGITSTSPDPDVIPPGVVERLEIVPDGGSAIYGSDAVAGVLNFQTRRRFDGLKVGARYGVAKHYQQGDLNITAGRSWSNGGAYLSYNHAEHASILGRERDYVHEFPNQVISGLALSTIQCAPGNVVQSGRIFALPFTTTSAVVGTANPCDASDPVTAYPSEERNSVLGSVSQDVGDKVQLDLKGFFTRRELGLVLGPYRYTQPVSGPAASPFFASHNVGPNQNVSGQFGALDAQRQAIDLETWGLLPTLTVDLGHSWRMRLLGSYSESTTTSHAGGLNAAALTRATTAGLFNPYDPATSDPATLAAVTRYEVFGKTDQRLADLRVVFDGDLFTLPGGAVKLAVGAETYGEHLTTRKGEVVPGFEKTGYPGLSIGGTLIVPAIAAAPEARLSRTVKAVFGEVVAPIVTEKNALPGLRELTVSVAGRYDDYSDFGNTFNPKVGVTYRPLTWVKLRGSWGKSYVAPSLADAPPTEFTQILVVPASAFAPPPALVQNGTYPALTPGQVVLGARGNSPNIEPQRAKTTSFGVEIQPPIIPGLSVDLSYYKIDFKGVIGLPPVGGPATATLYRDYPFLVQASPTVAQINSLVAQSSVPVTLCAPLPTCVYALLDIRKRNLGDFKLDGLDLNAKYRRDTGFGSLSFQVGGTYELNRDQSAASGLPFSDLLAANNTRLRLRTSVAAQIGDLLAQASWNHMAGFDLDPAAGLAPQQARVRAFNVVNLFFRYEVKGQGAFSDLELSLNVDNVFDQDPPEFRGTTSTAGSRGYTNGSTLGRFVQIGIEKRF